MTPEEEIDDLWERRPYASRWFPELEDEDDRPIELDEDDDG